MPISVGVESAYTLFAIMLRHQNLGKGGVLRHKPPFGMFAQQTLMRAPEQKTLETLEQKTADMLQKDEERAERYEQERQIEEDRTIDQEKRCFLKGLVICVLFLLLLRMMTILIK